MSCAKPTTRLTEPAESLEVAISQLGLARTEVPLNRLPTLGAAEIPTAFRQLLSVSLRATQQATLYSPDAWRVFGMTFIWAACCFCRRYGRWRSLIPSCSMSGNCASFIRASLPSRSKSSCSVSVCWRLADLQGQLLIGSDATSKNQKIMREKQCKHWMN